MSLNFIDKLTQDIENKENNSRLALELACISQLVYQSGIQQQQIVTLRVLDVVAPDGTIKNAIKAKKAARDDTGILLTDDAKHTLKTYLEAMKSKYPDLFKKRKPLFPSYGNVRTLRRHWKKFGVSYEEIRHNGMKAHHIKRQRSGLPISKIYSEGGRLFGITPRQYYAVVADRKMPSGQQVNNGRQMYKLLALLEAAERIDKNDPTAKAEAARLLAEAEQALEKIKSVEMRNRYNAIIDNIKEKVGPLLNP